MDFIVLDRFSLEAADFGQRPHIIISISNPGSPPVDVPQGAGCRGVLRLEFDDIEPPPVMEDDKLMTPAQAGRICRFVAGHRDEVELIVCQCEAGQSRSPGVAAALASALGADDRQFFHRYFPNRHVYRLVLRAAEGTLTPAQQ